MIDEILVFDKRLKKKSLKFYSKLTFDSLENKASSEKEKRYSIRIFVYK